MIHCCILNPPKGSPMSRIHQRLRWLCSFLASSSALQLCGVTACPGTQMISWYDHIDYYGSRSASRLAIFLLIENCQGNYKALLKMRESAEGGEEDDFVCVGRSKSKKPCHRLVWPSGISAHEAEAPGRMYCCRPKSVNRVVMANEVSKKYLSR